jgi:MFS family permease
MIPLPSVMRTLSQDGRLLFWSRILRMFGYGLLSVVLVLYLVELRFNASQVGLLLTLTLLGDTVISLWITTRADRIGRQRMLLAGAGLMLFAGVCFVLTHNFLLLVIAATIGVISPSGTEVGPFLSIEQAALSQAIDDKQRTHIFAWYNLAGSFATATGALVGGALVQVFRNEGFSLLAAYRVPFLVYAVLGVSLALLFLKLSGEVEAHTTVTPAGKPPLLGLHRSRNAVFKLTALFALDAFAGGFVLQSIVAYWFSVRFGVKPALLGSIFFATNIVAGISALAAVKVAERIGLVNTMVVTHLPSNVLLILVPLMPNLPLAIALLILRFSISQMDVPTRQSYTMAVVPAEERSAAAGVTGTGRTIGAALSPALAGLLLTHPVLFCVPFFLGGGLKIVYDLLLYRSFRATQVPEKQTANV